MIHRGFAALLVALAVGVAVGWSAGSADGQDDKSKSDKNTLSVQWAKTQLQLAEMSLARVQELNKKMPGTLIGSMVSEFEQEVEMARVELAIVEKEPLGNPYKVCIERVRQELRTAEDRAKRALETHEKAPTVVTKSDVERMRLVAVMADYQLQRGLQLENASPHDQLQWQLEVLGEDLDRVRQYTYLLGQNRFGQFSPGGL